MWFVDQSRDDRPAFQVDDLGIRPPGLNVVTERREAPAFDGDRGHHRPRVVHGMDFPVFQDEFVQHATSPA